MPHNRLASLPKALPDEDLHALGLIVSYWSLAESSLETLLMTMASVDQQQWVVFVAERNISFSKKTRAGKRLLKATSAATPEFLSIGTDLMIVGNQLALNRKVMTHWVGSREPGSETIRFF